MFDMAHHLITRYPTRYEVETERLSWPEARPHDLPDDDLGYDRLGARFWWSYLTALMAIAVAVWWWKG